MYAKHGKHTLTHSLTHRHTNIYIPIKINRREKGIQLIITFQMITLATNMLTHCFICIAIATAHISNTHIFGNQRVNICCRTPRREKKTP